MALMTVGIVMASCSQNKKENQKVENDNENETTEEQMAENKEGGKTLVAYFSATGTTKKAAEQLAEIIGADLYEIEPEQPYTDADLDWHNDQSRSSVEMKDLSSRPAIKGTVENLADYDKVYIGFPIWWYTAPTIINTFIESIDIAGKTAIAFCTSGGTGISGCENDLKNAYPEANWKPGKRLFGRESDDEIINWVNE
jgi:flavodoxin